MNKQPLSFKAFFRIASYFSSIFLLAVCVNAATFTVTKTADTDDNVCDSDCSLREAIAAANSATSDDVIEFDPVVFATAQTITLSGDTFAVANSGTLTINGTGATKLTLNGNDTKRLFYFMPQSNVTLRRMTITNGGGQSSVVLACGGGAILTNESVSRLEDVIVSNSRTFAQDANFCYGGGIFNSYTSTMTILRSRIENNVNTPGIGVVAVFGGGISNAGALTITESSVTGNTGAGNGGGIHNSGTLNLTNATISGNSATGYGGVGGGIKNNATVNAIHVTIVNNSSAADKGAGVYTNENPNEQVFTSRNSICANNISAGYNRDFYGVMNSGGYNLVENIDNSMFTRIIGDTTGNILGQDPQLQPLASAGTGITLAHKPFPTSPVIDKGKTFGIFADQRSVNRPLDLGGYPNADRGDGADIGAIEMQLTDFSKGALFDFDGDRKTDVSILRPGSTSAWWIRQSVNGQTPAANFGLPTDKIVSADYTGDGKADIAVFRPSNNTWYILRSENSTSYALTFGISGDVPVVGDFDGDSIYDQAVFRPGNGYWYVRRSSDAQVFIQQFGIEGDQPVAADYDGDGKDDIAIFRPSTGAWWISRSGGSGIIAIQFGQTGDKTVQGDYTGDGKADVAFWRPSNGFWYILRSEDFSYYGYPFGSADDLPVPGDYDGDGKSDAAVYRPSNQGWYLQRSTAGFTALQYGISGDYPIPNAYVRQ